MAKTGVKRTKFERERDLVVISSLLLRGHMIAEIPAKLQQQTGALYTITPQMVSYEVSRQRRIWSETVLDNIGEVKARELARLDELEREAWREWERSKLERKTKTQESRTGGKNNTKKSSLKLEDTLGDPRYLVVISGIVEQRRKIMGLDAPARIQAEIPTLDELLAKALDAAGTST